MKNFYTLLIALFSGLGLMAQQDVYLKINHKLGSANFDTLTTVSNNKGDNFQVTRLYYYISRIKLTYDSGQSTVLKDTYIMVDARKPVNKFLGSFNFTTLESIEFGIGVDTSKNHSDITLYPPNHALSFQSPSMHWGWAAGYRFVALEGLTGLNMSQSWQLHALGDKNYGITTPILTAGHKNGNDLIIALDADYTKAATDIRINANLNYHGEDQNAPKLLSNFQSEVFSTGSPGVGLDEVGATAFSLVPNPSSGSAKIILEGLEFSDATVTITDLTGRILSEQSIDGRREVDLSFSDNGLYLITLSQKGKVIETKKLLVQ